MSNPLYVFQLESVFSKLYCTFTSLPVVVIKTGRGDDEEEIDSRLALIHSTEMNDWTKNRINDRTNWMAEHPTNHPNEQRPKQNMETRYVSTYKHTWKNAQPQLNFQ